MTDAEIIKALECCRKGKCRECCMDEEYLSINECTAELAKEALDLIQRQQKRIERLKDNLDAVLKERAACDVDRIVERLEELSWEYLYDDCKKLYCNKDCTQCYLNRAIAIVKGVQNE